jgi:ribonucleoside-diphosphate reductase alpha chain
MVPFDSGLIGRAIANAFRAELNLADQQPLAEETDSEVRVITEDVATEIAEEAGSESGTDVERVQDIVEMQLMKRGHFRVARCYIVYRAERAKIRSLQPTDSLAESVEAPKLRVRLEDGVRVDFDASRIRLRL